MHVVAMTIVATVLDSALCLFLDKGGPDSWRIEVSGSPLWSWYVGGLHQAIVFPSFCSYAMLPVLQGKLPFREWLSTSFSDGSAPLGCVYLHVALLAYFIKDCLMTKLSAIIWAHHIVCLLAVTSSMTGVLERSAGVFGLGASILELGSFANSVCEVQQAHRGTAKALRSRLTPIMMASNLLAIVLVVWYACTFTGSFASTVAWWTAAVVGAGLSVVRQQEWQSRVQTDQVGANYGSRSKAF